MSRKSSPVLWSLKSGCKPLLLKQQHCEANPSFTAHASLSQKLRLLLMTAILRYSVTSARGCAVCDENNALSDSHEI